MSISNIIKPMKPAEPNHIVEETKGPYNRPLIIFGFCLFLSFMYLLICTKSSPLYPFNDWVDANAFFTLGKGMMNGAIPYRDLFETKGILLYFIHGLAYLISNTSFLGIYIFEVISFSIFFCFFLLQAGIPVRSFQICLDRPAVPYSQHPEPEMLHAW